MWECDPTITDVPFSKTPLETESNLIFSTKLWYFFSSYSLHAENNCAVQRKMLRSRRITCQWFPEGLLHSLFWFPRFQYVRLIVRPPVRPSVRPCVWPSTCPFVRVSERPSVHPSVHLSVCLSVCLSIRPSIHPPDHPSVYPTVRLSNRPSIRPFMQQPADWSMLKGLRNRFSDCRSIVNCPPLLIKTTAACDYNETY